MDDQGPPRILPRIDSRNRAFWSGGSTGTLLIQRCVSCHLWHHPPADACPSCSGDLVAQAVSGRGTLFSYTENFQPFNAAVPVPYIIAIVELEEQADLRLPTNIVHCRAGALRTGMPVHVLFERQGEVFVPVFEPLP